MKLTSIVLAGLLTVAAPVTAVSAPLSLTPAWVLTGLQSPESAALSADGDFLYVSNIGGDGDVRDGNGFISKVSLDGKLIVLKWAEGMDAPKGIALKDGRLFAADIDKLVELDATTGRVLNRFPVDGARFLNDVAVAPDGTVLVSDSGTARIHALKDGIMTVWADDPRLRSINGLLPEDSRLVITTMSGVLLAMDYRTRAIDLLAVGVANGDGVIPLGEGAYLVGEWPGRLFEVSPNGALRVVLDTREAKSLINDFIAVRDSLFVPNLEPGTLTSYRMVR